ncbi:hypothetical protein ALC62_12520 [Cyphomyrmex costatus]|uniref:Uncharacterized protein n=1 Tax=Cyphomyrmex costatus TaxID=456900 RepID=A0A195C9D6_9HYME|nr:hypothetical protein ALC62_12520 [Cyphomyrmex costatus]
MKRTSGQTTTTTKIDERQTDEGGREIVKKKGVHKGSQRVPVTINIAKGSLFMKTEIPLQRVKKVNDAIACIKKGIPRRKTAARLRGGRSEEAWRIKWQDQEEKRRVGGRSGGGK